MKAQKFGKKAGQALKGKGSRIIRVKPRDRETPETFWFLIDLFKRQPEKGWSGQKIDFFRSDGVFGGGLDWTLEVHLGIDFTGEIEARVLLLDQDPDRGTGWLWRCEDEVIAYMKKVQHRLHEMGYMGGFRPDPISGGFCAHFYRKLADEDDVREERQRLSSLDLNDKKGREP
jgi:hypothetical protein